MTRWARLRRWVRHVVLGQHIFITTGQDNVVTIHSHCQYPGCTACSWPPDVTVGRSGSRIKVRHNGSKLV